MYSRYTGEPIECVPLLKQGRRRVLFMLGGGEPIVYSIVIMSAIKPATPPSIELLGVLRKDADPFLLVPVLGSFFALPGFDTLL